MVYSGDNLFSGMDSEILARLVRSSFAVAVVSVSLSRICWRIVVQRNLNRTVNLLGSVLAVGVKVGSFVFVDCMQNYGALVWRARISIQAAS